MEDEGGLQELQQEKGRVRRDKGGRGGGDDRPDGVGGWGGGGGAGLVGFQRPRDAQLEVSLICLRADRNITQPRPPRVTSCYQPAAAGGSEKDEGKKKKRAE